MYFDFFFLNYIVVFKLILYIIFCLENVIIFIILMCNFDFCDSKDLYKVVLGDYDWIV